MSEKITMYRLIYHKNLRENPTLAVCKTEEECKQIIKKRQPFWKECIGYDITPQIEIVPFQYVNELEEV